MFGYIVRRLFSAALVVILASMTVFAFFFLVPKDPARPLCQLNGRCNAEKLALLTEEMGFNDSVVHQYGIWAKGLFVDRTISFGPTYHCDAPCLGISYSTRTEVTSDLVKKYPATLSIAIGASMIFLPLGVLLGVVAARYRGTGIDRGLLAGSLLVYSIPVFVIGLVAWVLFSLTWQIWPDTSYVPLTENPAKWFWHLLLPWLVIGLTSTTAYTRYARGSMIESLGEDYVRTATAKGLRSQTVMLRHALRAAIVPVVTIFGLDFSGLLIGTVTIEYIFNIDGIGRWGIEALRTPIDFPVIECVTLVGAFIIVIVNLLTDLVYSVIDPRVRLV